jgi:hypothetical protein
VKSPKSLFFGWTSADSLFREEIMKRSAWTLAIVLILAAQAAVAVPDAIEQSAERLARTAGDLAADAYRGFRDRDRGNRADVEALFLTYRFSASADLFRQMVRDRRPDSELRDAAELMHGQIREADRQGFGRRSWQEMSRMLDDIERELGSGRGGRRDDYDSGNRINGRMRWRGRVDNEIQVMIQGSSATTRVVTGSPTGDGTTNFTSPLPRRPLSVAVNRLRGRGHVEVVQQPTRNNEFTAVVMIRDNKGGSDDYEFELIW